LAYDRPLSAAARQGVFFGEEDYVFYRTLLAEGCRAAEVAVWAYCLMPNHVHLILVPSHADGSPRFVARLEKRLARSLARRKPGPKPRDGV
jgi:putative transposase